MSTIEHTASVTFGKTPLGRRIAELMQERGDAFSIRAFSERLGVNRETFRQTLLGNRPISITLLEKVSEGLKISEDRLRHLNEKEQAYQVIEANLERATEYLDFFGIFQIMKTVALDDPEFAISVNKDLKMPIKIRNAACKSLMDYYTAKGDGISVMRYYEQVRKLSSMNYEYFEEGF